MNTSQTWRTYLGELLDGPGEKTRAANELGVSALTLTRWIEGKTEPRLHSLRKLPEIFPGHERRLTELIREAYDPRPESSLVVTKHIPPEFTARVLASLASTAGPIVFSAICNLVLRQAIEQLDHDLLGMEIIIAQCTPPQEKKSVRSLCERFGVGSPPWTTGVSRRLLFLGAESLCGYVLATNEPGVIQNIENEQGLLPRRAEQHEKSAAAYPILRRGRLAGTFLVSSAQTNFFTSEQLTLVEQYANLAALAFHENEFYRPREISLEVMPHSSLQVSLTLQFRQRTLETRKQQDYHLSEIEAERLVLQNIENELLQFTGDQVHP